MQTHFSLEQLKDPVTAEAERILRACVHCGFCTATCPTFVLNGDELDSPRGRIYLIKDMLEKNRPADPLTVKHLDRCLSCLACMTVCPSGVNYRHLIDRARSHIEKTFQRPWQDRLLRTLLGAILPYPQRFRFALGAARLAEPLRGVLPRLGRSGERLAAMLGLAPRMLSTPRSEPLEAIAAPAAVARVALLSGCVQSVLRPDINQAAARLLAKLGIAVLSPNGEGCCGALRYHLGQEERALRQARHNIDLWNAEIERGGVSAILVTASGCGSMVKDYGYLLRNDKSYAAKAARISALTEDVTEFLAKQKLPPPSQSLRVRVAYHSACSLQHGQKIEVEPRALLRQAGFELCEIPEGHLCCGSAGTYNILEPEIAGKLRDRKIANIEKTASHLIATGNIGCLTQIASGTRIPVLHTIELLDFAYGGPRLFALQQHPD
ncbi:MAG TPA: glycolate oxidase subunit GlcF [Methylocella sp.]|nr:glycolate oxidase subunit GlcF [Methylocella sp.]